MDEKKGRQLEKPMPSNRNLPRTKMFSRFFTEVTLTESIQRDAVGDHKGETRELVLRMRLKDWVSFKDAKRAMLEVVEMFEKASGASDAIDMPLQEATYGNVHVLNGTLRDNFPNILLTIRKERKLTRAELASMTGVSVTWVGLCERGMKKLSDFATIKIAGALRIPLKEFYEPDAGSEIIIGILKEDFPMILKRIRTGEGMSRAELASNIGVSVTWVGLCERGMRKPSYSLIMKICEIFKLPADVFYHTEGLPEVSGNGSLVNFQQQ